LKNKDGVDKVIEDFENFNILGYYPIVLEAVEPSNVYWENLQNTTKTRCKRACTAFVIGGIILLIIMSTILYLMYTFKTESNLQYPKNTNCEEINAHFDEKKE